MDGQMDESNSEDWTEAIREQCSNPQTRGRDVSWRLKPCTAAGQLLMRINQILDASESKNVAYNSIILTEDFNANAMAAYGEHTGGFRRKCCPRLISGTQHGFTSLDHVTNLPLPSNLRGGI